MKGNSVSNSKTCSVASSNKSSNSSKYSLMRASNGKTIHHSLAAVKRQIKNFKRKHLVSKSKIDFSTCSRFLESDILPEWNIKAEELGTHEQFLRLILRKPLDEDIASSEEFIDLLSLSERAQDFDSVIKGDRQKLSDILEQHILNTCVSLKEEDEESNFTNVSEYDQIVGNFRSQIHRKWNSIESSIVEYKNDAYPFIRCVENGEKLLSKMRHVCNQMMEVCKLANDWVTEDEAYPAKLEEEMASTVASRDQIQEKIKEVKEKRAENSNEIERLQKYEERAEKYFHDSRKEKRKLKQRLADLEDRKIYLKEELGKKRKEKDKLKTQLSDSKQTSSRDIFDLNAKMATIEASVDHLEEQEKITERQLKRVTKDLKPVADKTYEFKVDMVTARHHKENLKKENSDLDIDLGTLEKRYETLADLLVKLKKIREMKLSGEAFRKSLRLRNRREAAYANGKHDLDEACKVAANGIGKDWKTVYFRLPFDPPRDPAKLERDVSVLDHIAFRGDVSPEKQALKCLERWRTLHRRGGIRDLVQVLKDLKKKQLAREIHNRFVPVAV